MTPLKFEIRPALNPPTYPLDLHTGLNYQVWRTKGIFRKEKLIQTFINKIDAQIACDSANGHQRMPPMDNF